MISHNTIQQNNFFWHNHHTLLWNIFPIYNQARCTTYIGVLKNPMQNFCKLLAGIWDLARHGADFIEVSASVAALQLKIQQLEPISELNNCYQISSPPINFKLSLTTTAKSSTSFKTLQPVINRFKSNRITPQFRKPTFKTDWNDDVIRIHHSSI